MAVIGSTEDGRIGTAETEFKAFQPFFVEHDPPRILTEGDEISLPVVVRNYLDRLQKVDLEIKPENWFSLLGPARKQTSVAAGDAARQTFDFRIVSSGEDRPQRITAIGNNANDAIEKPVTVHPDGEELSTTAGDILSNSAALEVKLPENAIPNSTRAELKIYPNLMAHVVESVEGIMSASIWLRRADDLLDVSQFASAAQLQTDRRRVCVANSCATLSERRLHATVELS